MLRESIRRFLICVHFRGETIKRVTQNAQFSPNWSHFSHSSKNRFFFKISVMATCSEFPRRQLLKKSRRNYFNFKSYKRNRLEKVCGFFKFPRFLQNSSPNRLIDTSINSSRPDATIDISLDGVRIMFNYYSADNGLSKLP